MQKYIFLFLCAAVITLTACVSTIPKPDLDLSEYQFSPLRMEPVIDPNLIRIDLIRNIQAIDKSSSTVIGYTATGGPIKTSNTNVNADTKERIEYSPVCIDFGNGLRLDTNGNLYLSIDEILDLGKKYTLSCSSGFEASKITRADDTFTSSNSTMGFANKSVFTFMDNSLYSENSKHTIVYPFDNGYSLFAYNTFGGQMSKQDITKTDNTIEYKIIEGNDLLGKTTLTQDESGITGRIRWYKKDIFISIRSTSDKININYENSNGNKRYIKIQRDNDEIIASINDNYGVVVKITDNRLMVDFMEVPGLLDVVMGGNNKHQEIGYYK